MTDLDTHVREERFGQHDHVRRFGKEDIDQSLNCVKNVNTHLLTKPLDYFSEEQLIAANIPSVRWDRFSGATPFLLRHEDVDMSPHNDQIETLITHLHRLDSQLAKIGVSHKHATIERDLFKEKYLEITESRTWRSTAPVRYVLSRLKRLVH